jgi:hypothetical protein
VDTYAPYRTKRPSRRWLVPVGIVVALILTAAAVVWLNRPRHQPVAAAVPAPTTAVPVMAVVGTVTLNSASIFTNRGAGAAVGQRCSGNGRYLDLTEGAPVTITDASGAVVALTKLGTGELGLTAGGYGLTCAFPFSASVPLGKAFYSVQVAQRDQQRFAESALSAPLAITIGNGI